MGITKKRIRNSKKDHRVKICMILSVVNYGLSLENTEHNEKMVVITEGTKKLHYNNLL